MERLAMNKYSNIHNEGPIESTNTFTAKANPCNHDTGWFHTVNVWIFTKRIFVCEKCFTVLDAKEKK